MIALERAREQLLSLELKEAAAMLQSRLEAAAHGEVPYVDFLIDLLGAELDARRERYLLARTRLARLPFHKRLSEFEFDFQPSVDERQLRELATLNFAVEAANVLFLGPPEWGGIPAYDPRGYKGMGLGYATSNRGACHLRGYTPAAEALGIPVETDPLDWTDKAELLIIFQDLHAVSDSLDICKFTAFAEGAGEYLAQYAAYTGIEMDADEFVKAGERIYNLERYYNNLAGFDGSDDTLPKRFIEETGDGPAADSVCELDKMLKDYYERRGWNDGVVPEVKLKELDIAV